MTTRLAGWIVGALAIALVLSMFLPFVGGAVLVLAVPVAVHWHHVAPDVSVLGGDHVDLDSTRAAVLDAVHPIILLVHLVFWSPWPVLGAWAGREHRGPPPVDA